MSRPRLLADESIPRTVIVKLREHEYDVLVVWEVKPGAKDEEVLGLAVSEYWVVLTSRLNHLINLESPMETRESIHVLAHRSPLSQDKREELSDFIDEGFEVQRTYRDFEPGSPTPES